MAWGWSGYAPLPPGTRVPLRARLRHHVVLLWISVKDAVSIRAEIAWSWLRWNLKGRKGA
jgi:hypothetical protein